MKKFLLLFLFGIMVLSTFTVSSAEIEGLSGRAYILYCVNNGEVILGKNENTQLAMASTTKIMTALIAFEKAEKDDIEVEYTEAMTAEGSSMYLKSGDKLPLSDLASGMLAASGNDGANAVAYTLGGSVEGFSRLMNEYAKKIGMVNTNFTNPSGLPDDNHYSTAYDMALLMSAAMENKSFSETTGRQSVEVDFIVPAGHTVTYENHNRLLSLYDYCIGGKTGYTKEAGRCLVTCAEKDGLRFVAVTLDDGNDWEDHISLYNYGFGKFSLLRAEDSCYEVPVLGLENEKIRLIPGKDSTAIIEASEYEDITTEVYIPSVVFPSVNSGEALGKLIYSSQGEIILEVPLIARSSVEVKKQNSIFRFFRNLFYRIF